MYKEYCVYIHKNRQNNKVYIGQTCQKPQRRWKKGKGYKNCYHFFNAINKYGWDSFEHIILKQHLTLEEANYWESFYIKYYKTLFNQFGYNLSSGGSHPIPSKQTRQKMRQKKLGTKQTQQTKQKIRQSHLGKNFSKQHKEKLSQAAKNRKIQGFQNKKHTQATKEKIGRKNGKAVLCVQTGIVYYSAAEACRQLGLKSNHINDCINNPTRYKTFGGYHWKRYMPEEEL